VGVPSFVGVFVGVNMRKSIWRSQTDHGRSDVTARYSGNFVCCETLESRTLMTATIYRFVLVNSDTGKDILTFNNGLTLNLATLPSRHLNVRADTSSDTGSVKFGYDANANYRIESNRPFALAADNGKGTYLAWTPSVGSHTIVGTPFSQQFAAGTAGGKFTIKFSVTDVTPPKPPPTGPPVVGNWSQVFDEEFNAPLSSARWTQSLWGSTVISGDAEAYDPSAVTVNNGILSITASKQPLNGRSYTSGIITTGGVAGETAPGFSFKYGYVEASMKIPTGKGFWSALWTLPTPNANGTFHDGDGELDIAEILGATPNSLTMFTHKSTGRKGTDYNTGIDLSKGFHTYGMDWEPDHVTWYLDGKQLFSITDAILIPQVAEYLILNLMVGTSGSWAGAPTSSTVFPSSMQVDWVHVWQKTS
jgi:beta-glucanase (GH16 family)